MLLIFGLANSQDLVYIKFADKPSADTYFLNPTLMLSQKALDRRIKYDISLDIRDIPVEPIYVSQVEDLGIEPIAVSKWFNGVFAWCTDEQVSQVEALPFVSGVESFVRNTGKISSGKIQQNKFVETMEEVGQLNGLMDFEYGFTFNQVTQLNLDYLHNLGFTGAGISIAVLDNGFVGVDNIDGFSYIRNNGQIKGGYNFVANNENFYAGGGHGTAVLSTIGGYVEEAFVGTAIDADFYLFITEDNSHELPDEEVHWISAAERADSIGIDVINTSLGYANFDDSRYNYTYEDMDGNTTYISRAANIAGEKGIMVLVSAGNSGANEWHYITAPADAENILTIGAVDENGNPAYFSSFGPAADGRIKPDVDAMGWGATVISTNGTISYSSGTSFSSPIMAGAMACLIQAFPNTHPAELRQSVRASANLFNNPTDQMGYGIPDFGAVYDALMSTHEVIKESFISVFPNPTNDILNIKADKNIEKIQLFNMEGKMMRQLENQNQLNLSGLPQGTYFLKILLENRQTVIKKVIKK